MEHLSHSQIFEWICGEMPDFERSSCRGHLSACPHCRRQVLEAEALRLLAQESAGKATPSFAKNLSVEIKKLWVAEQLAQKTNPSLARELLKKQPQSSRRLTLAILLVALCLVSLALLWVQQEGASSLPTSPNTDEAPFAASPLGDTLAAATNSDLLPQTNREDAGVERAAKEILIEHSHETYNHKHHKHRRSKHKKDRPPLLPDENIVSHRDLNLGNDGLPEVELGGKASATPEPTDSQNQ